MVQENSILTKREADVINKKLQRSKLTQQDSNYLSRYVRPKLREMTQLDSRLLLQSIAYNQKMPAIGRYIKSIILKNVPNVSSITIYGSAIYTNYHDYNDIDVLVTVKKKSWKKLGEKLNLQKTVNKKSKLKIDTKIYSDDYVYNAYPHSITLIFELKDHKTIYGVLRYKQGVQISQHSLKMQSDYSEGILQEMEDNGISYVQSGQLYAAIRNLFVIKLLMAETVDNVALNQILEDEMGKNTIKKLKDNTRSPIVKKIAYLYLRNLYNKTMQQIDSVKGDITWGKNKT